MAFQLGFKFDFAPRRFIPQDPLGAFADEPAQRGQDAKCHGRLPRQQADECVAVDDRERGSDGGGRRRRSGAAFEQSQLAEEVALAEVRKLDDLPFGVGAGDANPARLDEIDTVRLVALSEYHVARRDGPLAARRAQRVAVDVVEIVEEGGPRCREIRHRCHGRRSGRSVRRAPVRNGCGA